MKVAPIADKLSGFGWNTFECDGHDIEDLIIAMNQAKNIKERPTAIIAKTVKGKGVSYMENVAGWHGKAPDDELFEQAMKDLGGEL